jgi:lycopene cyclase domain-containing protein
MLAFCFLGTLPLELWLGVRVYRQTRRLLLTLLPVAAVFVGWDLYAIAQGHWEFDPEQTLGVLLPGGVPVEELLFFLVIPACAVLSFEAVRRVKGWPVE